VCSSDLKIQRKTLETRVDTLSRSLADYKEKMRAAGGHYASMMRELEVAEIELNEVEANIRSIEARHGRGELSLEGYRKLLGDYERRKEKTETTIDGILLRLREEIR
jgi:chromosome segregation ATPase